VSDDACVHFMNAIIALSYDYTCTNPSVYIRVITNVVIWK